MPEKKRKRILPFEMLCAVTGIFHVSMLCAERKEKTSEKTIVCVLFHNFQKAFAKFSIAVH
jgi:hypothetical protein